MPTRFDTLTRLLHWTLAVLIVGVFALALVLDDIPRGPPRATALSLHVFLGTAILILVVLRGVWALARPRLPAVPMPRWMALASKLAHGLLYLLMIVTPGLGLWLYGVRGDHASLFGVSMPALFA